MSEQAQTPGESRKDLEALLIAKAWKDPVFKQVLMSDPKAAIKEALKIEIPEGVEVEVLEETPAKLYLVLPRYEVDVTEGELSDEELELVAGGKDWLVPEADTPLCVAGVRG